RCAETAKLCDRRAPYPARSDQASARLEAERCWTWARVSERTFSKSLRTLPRRGRGPDLPRECETRSREAPALLKAVSHSPSGSCCPDDRAQHNVRLPRRNRSKTTAPCLKKAAPQEASSSRAGSNHRTAPL